MLRYRISFNNQWLCLCILSLAVIGGLIFILSAVPTALGEETPEKPEANSTQITETSDTERILSLQTAIEADQKTFGELKEDLKKKETEFRKMTAKLEEIREQLQAKEHPTETDLARLKGGL